MTDDAVIVDTNVLVVASAIDTHASPGCIVACVDALEAATTRTVVLLDDGGRILREYLQQPQLAGTPPNPGSEFLVWVLTNQGDPARCQFAAIVSTAEERGFLEFPDDPRLVGFDKSDRKFVAVAVAHGNESVILNATDSDWADFFEPLTDNGIRVQFLCPDMAAPPSVPV